jgi:hypothetical protein
MSRRILLVALTLAFVVPAAVPGQSAPNFAGTWKLASVDPPVQPGRGGGGARGGAIAGPFADSLLAAAPDTIVIAQSGNDLTVQIGSAKATYTLDNKLMSTPPNDVMAFKTRAHWQGATLHLHYKQGMNWGRDALSITGNTLTLVRDLEAGGQSTVRTLTYARSS